ncbi:MAG: RluA family pseudouridine synthase [Alphaproteobacteria bacterium]
MTGVQQKIVAKDEAEIRLDRWFKRHFPELTHGRLEKLLRTGQVRIDGKRAKASERLAAGQTIRIPPLGTAPPASERPEKPRMRYDADDAKYLKSMVLYEDDDVIVVDKPAGLPVQGGTKSERNLDALLDYLRGKHEERPRLVHRLDRDTSGVLLLARSASVAARLGIEFRERTTKKIYWALTAGAPTLSHGTIDIPVAKIMGSAGERMIAVDDTDEDDGLDTKRAITKFKVMERAGGLVTWLALMPLTGRTHQLRVHLAAIGIPIVGDGKYGGSKAFVSDLPRQLHLHSRRLIVPHPRKGTIDVTAELPEHMRKSFDLFGFNANDRSDPFARD